MRSLSAWRVRGEKSQEDELHWELLIAKAVPKEFSTTGQQQACSGQTQKLAILGASLDLGEARSLLETLIMLVISKFTLLYILFCGLSSLSAANQEMTIFLKGQARILAYSFLKLVSEVKPAGDFL